MMSIEQIGRKMPYIEGNEYVERLVNKAAENAICQGKGPARHISMRILTAAASLLLLAGIATAWFLSSSGESQSLAQVQQAEPLELFLSNISDEEARQIEYYEIEEIHF